MMIPALGLTLLLFSVVSLSAAFRQTCPDDADFVVGTYTGQPWMPSANGSGIVFASFSDNQLRQKFVISPAVTGENPSYVAKSGAYLYAVNENGAEGSLVEIQFGRTHPYISSTSSLSGQGGTTHVAIVYEKRNGHRIIAVANYNGAITTFVRTSKGSLRRAQLFTIPSKLSAQARNPSASDRQEAPHPHMILPYRYEGLKIAVPDLGSDSVFVFSVNKYTGRIKQLTRVQVRDGDGPRHAAKHSTSNTIFVVNELSLSLSVLRPGCSNNKLLGLCYSVGFLKEGEGVEGATAAAIRVSDDGQFLYASIRNPDDTMGSIVAYRLKKNGDVRRRIGLFSSGGAHPRDFHIVERVQVGDECQSYLAVANTFSNKLVLIQRNRSDGKLIYSGNDAHSLRIDTAVSVTV